MMKLVASVLLTLLATGVYAQGVEESGPTKFVPTRYLRFQAAELGYGGGSTGQFGEVRALSLAYCAGRLEYGISGVELSAATIAMGDFAWSLWTVAPLRCRFDLAERRVRTGFLYNSVPSLYAEAVVSALSVDLSGTHARLLPCLYGRLSVGSAVEYCGIGLGLEAGVLAEHSFTPGSYGVGPCGYVVLSLRALTGSISLTGIPREY